MRSTARCVEKASPQLSHFKTNAGQYTVKPGRGASRSGHARYTSYR